MPVKSALKREALIAVFTDICSDDRCVEFYNNQRFAISAVSYSKFVKILKSHKL